AAARAEARSGDPNRSSRRRAAVRGRVRPPPAARAPGPSILLVLFPDGAVDVGRRRRAEEPLAERLVLEETGDARERLQMRAGRVFRRDEEKEEMGRLAVERGEVDAARAPAERGDHARQAGKLPVWDGDPLAERGAVQPLPVLERLHETDPVDLGMT